MKKLLMGLSLVALLAGCASQDNGMGGTSDDSMKTDTYNTGNASSSDQFQNNVKAQNDANYGTGSSTVTAPNNGVGTP